VRKKLILRFSDGLLVLKELRIDAIAGKSLPLVIRDDRRYRKSCHQRGERDGASATTRLLGSYRSLYEKGSPVR
jgi:hypothetical protein